MVNLQNQKGNKQHYADKRAKTVQLRKKILVNGST